MSPFCRSVKLMVRFERNKSEQQDIEYKMGIHDITELTFDRIMGIDYGYNCYLI